MIYGIKDDWFSIARNLERIVYCCKYIRKFGWPDFCTHLFIDLLPIKKVSGIRMFFQGVYSAQAGNSWTLKSYKLDRLLNHATSINLIVTCLTMGGAVEYQKQMLKTQVKRSLFFVLRVAETSGVLKVEAWMNGKVVLRFIVKGLAFFNGIPANKCEHIFINDLITWNFYLGSKAMQASNLGVLGEQIVSLKTHLRAKLIYLMHDCYPACPRWLFLYKGLTFCGDAPIASVCKECLNYPSVAQPYLYDVGTDVVKWRDAARKLLAVSDEVRCFSLDSKKRIKFFFPELQNLTIVPHSPLFIFNKIKISRSSEIVIGIVGNISAVKGSQIVLSLGEYIEREKLNARIVVVGTLIDVKSACKCIKVKGAYVHSELGGMLESEKVNVAFFPSIVPETFSYVTQELMMLGVPVVCFNFGAQAEHVSTYKMGRIIKSLAVENIWQTIRLLHKESQEEL